MKYQKLKVMKSILNILMILTLFLSCKAQQTSTTTNLPKIENYTKGEFIIKVAPFGFGNEIPVGKVAKDGVIHFN